MCSTKNDKNIEYTFKNVSLKIQVSSKKQSDFLVHLQGAKTLHVLESTKNWKVPFVNMHLSITSFIERT